jgi:hypothetical protein
LLAQWTERFAVRLHAYVLMDNHYHLLVETPHANLSAAMQWLQVSYTAWFNRRHGRAGHLFQGRFKAIVFESEESAWELSRYVHLNPVRLRRLGLDKATQERSRAGLGEKPDPKLVAERLRQLRTYPWSSYRAYVRLADSPPWLTSGRVLELGEGRNRSAQVAAHRQYVEEAVREGMLPSPWERLRAGLLLGSEQFVRRIGRRARGDAREQPALRRMQPRPTFEQVVAVVEQLKGEKWDGFRERYGDWGRDMVLYVARRRCGLTLRELAELAGGMDYSSVATAVRRFARRAGRARKLHELIIAAEMELSNS